LETLNCYFLKSKNDSKNIFYFSIYTLQFSLFLLISSHLSPLMARYVYFVPGKITFLFVHYLFDKNPPLKKKKKKIIKAIPYQNITIRIHSLTNLSTGFQLTLKILVVIPKKIINTWLLSWFSLR